MEAYFVLVLVALTSLGAGLLQWRRQPRPGETLRAAASRMLEAIGLTIVFFLGNVATGALLTVAARALNLTFISIYLSTDVTLLVLSLLQALVYQRWREARPGS
ncbi:MAG TPA: hypothetical protein VMT87_09655 [Vicinamibacteria bacterium]|nr:hypothetical protein [Vicinamibacteria bacterium]